MYHLFVLAACAAAPADPPAAAPAPADVVRKAPDPDKDETLLKEFDAKSFRVVRRVSLPNRVYVKKSAVTGNYQHYLSGSEGKLSNPPQVMLTGTVLSGDKLGGPADKYYALTAEGRWKEVPGTAEVAYMKNDEKDGRESIVFPHRTNADWGSGDVGEMRRKPDPDKAEVLVYLRPIDVYMVIRDLDLIEDYKGRVYAAKSGRTGKYEFMLLYRPDPLRDDPQVLLPGTILRGHRLGAPRRHAYRLDEHGKWRRLNHVFNDEEVVLCRSEKDGTASTRKPVEGD